MRQEDRPLFFSDHDCDACQYAISKMKKKGVWNQVREVDINASRANMELSDKYRVRYMPTLVDPKTGRHISMERLLKKIGSL